jgi:phosphoserine phosphatase RsbU/P
MLPMFDAMTAVPVSTTSQPLPNGNATKSGATTEATPVLALKELVASLQREQNKIQDLLSALGFALRSFNNLNQFLELTPLIAARVTDADGGALILSKPNGQVRVEQLHCHDSQECLDVRRALEQITRKINTSNTQKKTLSKKSTQPLLMSASVEEQIKQYFDNKVQLFTTPVLLKNVERGSLCIFSSDPEYNWTQTRRKLLQLVADQTAVAIANNELTVELRSKERQDRELEIASEIQLRLLPRNCPKIKGVELAAACKPANRVGGDYYDFIPANYDQLRQNPEEEANNQTTSAPWSIVIGDVMGKGVPAGLIMTMTRGMLRAEVLNRHSPAKILEHLNRVMYSDLENSHRFVTLFYSEYDPQTRMLSFSNAAHNPPFLWKAKSGEIQHLDTWGMLIGLDADSNYEDAKVQLAVGDIILYYTDGFTDAVNQNGDRFEEDNLANAFEWACENCNDTKEILDYLFERVEQFIGAENSNNDDMTLVVMKVQSEE